MEIKSASSSSAYRFSMALLKRLPSVRTLLFVTTLLSCFARLAMASALDVAPSPGADVAATGCMGCMASFLGLGIFLVLVFILNIVLLIWVARDAKARNMDGAAMWLLLVMFSSLLGLLLYIFARPAGNLVQCPACGNDRLQASAQCPHCGNGWYPAPPSY